MLVLDDADRTALLDEAYEVEERLVYHYTCGDGWTDALATYQRILQWQRIIRALGGVVSEVPREPTSDTEVARPYMLPAVQP